MNEFDKDLEYALEQEVIYKATFLRLDRRCASDGQKNPIVEIHNPSNLDIVHTAELKPGTKRGRHCDEANQVRQQVIDLQSQAGTIYVKVSYSTYLPDPNQSYCVRGTKECPYTAEEAFTVLTGENIFYARCVRINEAGKPTMMGYSLVEDSPIRRYGFLVPVRGNIDMGYVSIDGESLDETISRMFAENIITGKIISGSDKVPKLKSEDHIIVRQRKSTKSTYSFEPVVNLVEEDGASSPKGEPLITRVDGYDKGCIIHDLPVTSRIAGNREPNEMLGSGHVKRPEGEHQGFYYKPVKIIGAGEDMGRPVTARILNDGKGIILAERI